jgi:omega-amidase
MHVTVFQPDLYWHDPVANRAMLEEQIFALPHPTDLIVLPEMFTTGFTMNARAVAEPMGLTTFRWLRQMAAQTHAAITGSYVVQETAGPRAGQFYNRLVWMEPDGAFATYDKRHLFRMGDEHETYTAGTARLVRHWRGWRVCPLICYDLRFPVWGRNRPVLPGEAADENGLVYDLLLYVANWPAPRRSVWNALLPARAIENQSYVIGTNRVGTDGMGLTYAGDSAVIDYRGAVLQQQPDTAGMQQTTLSLNELRAFRQQFPAWMDADTFGITP